MRVCLAVSFVMDSSGENTGILSAVKRECIHPFDELPEHMNTSTELVPIVKEEYTLLSGEPSGHAVFSVYNVRDEHNYAAALPTAINITRDHNSHSDKLLSECAIKVETAVDSVRNNKQSQGNRSLILPLQRNKILYMPKVKISADLKTLLIKSPKPIDKPPSELVVRIRTNKNIQSDNTNDCGNENTNDRGIDNKNDRRNDKNDCPNDNTNDHESYNANDRRNDNKFQDNNQKVSLHETEYWCYKCSVKFFTIEGLNSHKMTHTVKTILPYECDKCDRSFINKAKLELHKNSHDSSRFNRTVKNDVGNNSECQSDKRKLNLLNEIYSCYICKAKFFTFEELKSHRKAHKMQKVREHKVLEHKDQEYKCYECDLVFANKNRYVCHKDGHRFYKCELCDKIIARLHKLKWHIRMKHNMQPEKTYPLLKDSSLHYQQVKHGNGERETLLERTCVVCGQEFDTRHLLMAHMRAYKRTCPKCQKKFSSIVDLKRHMITHFNMDTSLDYKCKKCNIDHTDLDSLNHHIVLSHPNETIVNPQLFPCNLCKKVFPTEFHLKRHIFHHEFRQRKRFICSKCNKSFSRKSDYENHKIIHTDQRPYSCKVCGTTYRQSRGLQRHMLTHKDSGPSTSENDRLSRPQETGWLCSKCGKVFRNKDSFRAHELSVHYHRKRKENRVCCEICGMLVNTRILKAHIEKHRKELNYSCNLCSKKFYTRGSLRSHMNVHIIPKAIRQARGRIGYQKQKQRMFEKARESTANKLNIGENEEENMIAK